MNPLKPQNEELEELVAQLQQANGELERFAYVASHDLKAPLRAISNLAGWIKEDIESETITNDTHSHLKMMLSRVARMEKLLDDLLVYARVGKKSGTLETIDITELVASVAEMLPIGKFEVATEFEVATLVSDRFPLEQVLMNLISNAIKHHNKKKGVITVIVRDRIDFMEFIVSDDGPGIPKEQQKEAFEMFRTLKPRDEVEGSGMGLALVKKIVETQGGDVDILPTDKGLSVMFLWPKVESK